MTGPAGDQRYGTRGSLGASHPAVAARRPRPGLMTAFIFPIVRPLHHEQPVVVPQVMHPPRRFQHVTSVRNGVILRRLLSSRRALGDPLDNGRRTRDGQLHQVARA